MGMFGDSKVYGRIPKQGESPITITVKSCDKVEFDFDGSNLKYNPNLVGKNGKDFGYHYQLTDTEGLVYNVGAWSLFFAIRDSGADVGDTIRIGHPNKGEYTVEILNKKPLISKDEGWE